MTNFLKKKKTNIFYFNLLIQFNDVLFPQLIIFFKKFCGFKLLFFSNVNLSFAHTVLQYFVVYWTVHSNVK